MKKLISLLLCCLVLFPLCACHHNNGKLNNPVDFYYLQTTYENGSRITKISSEKREAYGHSDDLNYLLRLYMTGPADPKLRSALPDRAQLMELTVEDNNAHILLRGMTFEDMSKLDISLACGCLAKTCFSIQSLDSVSINTEAGKLAGTEDIILYNDGVMIEDTYATAETQSE